MYGKIFDIQHCSLSDGNGIRTAIFLKGCPLRCAWCHNPESQSADSELLFYAHKCTGCGKCLRDCAARRLENGRIVINRKLCTFCGKCAEICPAGANEICGKIVSAEEVIAEAEKISRSILRAALRKEASRSRAENRRRKRNFRLNSFGLRKKKASIRR